MNIVDTLKISYSSLKTHKKRTFLTMLGLIIGTSSVILVMSVGAGAQSLITNQIERRGTDMVAVLPGASDSSGPPASIFGIVITTLTEEDAEAIEKKENVRHAKDVTAYVTGNDTLSYKDQEKNVTYTGTTSKYEQVERITLAKGRFFSDGEAQNREQFMVLGDRIARELFANENPIGKFVKLKKRRFRVIGVLAPKGSTVFDNPDDAVVIPLQTAQYKLLGVRHVSLIRLTVDDEKNIPITVSEIRQTLIERHDDEDFSIRNTADLLTTLVTITNALRFFLVAIATIALFVGGVGIMNIMLIAVRDKTKEVGLRKAVGATDRDILEQFLTESILIAIIGGIIGILLGIIISYGVARVVQSLDYDYSFIVSPLTIIVAFCACSLIGIIFGVYPARKAASLDPIEALRYE